MSNKRRLIKYVLEQNAAGYQPHVRPAVYTSVADDRRSICRALNWSYQQWYYAVCQQKREPYIYEQVDADKGWISPDLVGAPSILFSPRHENDFTVRVCTSVVEAIDYAMDELKPARTRANYARTGTTDPTVVLAALDTDTELRDQAQEVTDCTVALQKAHAKLYKNAKAAKQRILERQELAAEKSKLAKERALLDAEKAALGL